MKIKNIIWIMTLILFAVSISGYCDFTTDKTLFADNFNREDNSSVGISTSGHEWDNYAYDSILNNKLVINQVLADKILCQANITYQEKGFYIQFDVNMTNSLLDGTGICMGTDQTDNNPSKDIVLFWENSGMKIRVPLAQYSVNAYNNTEISVKCFRNETAIGFCEIYSNKVLIENISDDKPVSASKKEISFYSYGTTGNITIDNLMIWNYSIRSCPFIEYEAKFNPPTPTNNTINNSLPQYINFSCENNNHYLYLKNKTLEYDLVIDNNPAGIYNITTDGEYYYKANCGYDNSSEYKLTIDTTYPICLNIINNINITNGTYHKWNIQCSDDSFFSFNMSCDNGFNHAVSGLYVQYYNFTNQTLITGTTTCKYKYCDGHTKNKTNISTSIGNNKIIFDKKIMISSDNTVFTYEKKSDRISFNTERLNKTDYMEFIVSSDEYIYIMNQYAHKGWLITGKYWIDFENPNILISKIERIDKDIVKVKLWFNKENYYNSFESVGELNCVSGNQIIESIVTENTGSELFLVTMSCPNDSLTDIIWFVFIFFILIALYFFCKTIIRIPVVIVISLIPSLWFFLKFWYCSELVGLIGIIITFITILHEIFEPDK